MSSSSVLFVETANQAAWAAAQGEAARRTIVAVTAEAVEALDASGVVHTPASDVCDLRALAAEEPALNAAVVRLAREFESYAADRCASLRFDEPGFVTGNAYPLFHAAVGIAGRTTLYADAVKTLGVSRAAFFDAPAESWFAADGYERAPWIEVFRKVRPDVGVDLLEQPVKSDDPLRAPLHARLRNRVESWRQGRAGSRRPAAAANGPTLLFPTGVHFDWRPVVDDLRASGGARIVEMAAETRGYFWPFALVPAVSDRPGGWRTLDVPRYAADPVEESTVAQLFETWRREQPRSLVAGGIDIFDGFARHFAHVARCGPALLRHADRVAMAALDAVHPDAVCVASMPLLAEKRFAHACRRRSIPVIAYQHGGSYGTHRLAQHFQMELAHADLFLTYGEGTAAHGHPGFPLRARLVAVGSARIDAMRRLVTRSGPVARPKVLWIGEFSTANAFNTTHSLEDTRRYAIEREGLRRLAAAGSRLRVTYRPHRHQMHGVGTVRWIRRANPPIAVDAVRPLERLIAAADVVITDGSSGSAWYETLAMGRPLVLFCDPRQPLLWPEFERDLDRACRWCRDEPSLFAVLDALAASPTGTLAELQAIDARPFLERYVLHRGSGDPIDRVRRVLDAVRAGSFRAGYDLVEPSAR